VGVTRSRVIEEISRLAFSNISDVLSVENGQLIVREHTDFDRDTLSTIAEVAEAVNERGHRTLRVKQHDRLQALTLLARVLGLLINKTELSGPGGGPVAVEHVDHSARIRSRLDEIAKRLPAPTERPIIDVTPQAAKPSTLLAARIQAGKRGE
jgi:hypothetical protein